MGFAGLPNIQELFTILLMIVWVPIILGFLYFTFFRGRLGPVTRKAEIEETFAKISVLDNLGERPSKTARKEKRFFFGLMSGFVDSDEIDDPDELGGA